MVALGIIGLWPCAFLEGAAKSGFHVSGSYLAYSYDANAIYGENVRFRFSDYDVSAKYFRADLSARKVCAYGDVLLTREAVQTRADEFHFGLAGDQGRLLIYARSITTVGLGGTDADATPAVGPPAKEIQLLDILKSLIFFTGSNFEITGDGEVIGAEVTLFVGGLPSFGIKKANLSRGLKQSLAGFTVDQLWYARAQGLTGRLSYQLGGADRFVSRSQAYFQQPIGGDDGSRARGQWGLFSTNSLQLGDNVSLAASGDYQSSRLWNARTEVTASLSRAIGLGLDLSYLKPVNAEGEAWAGWRTDVDGGQAGRWSLSATAGRGSQWNASLAYSGNPFAGLDLSSAVQYSKLRFGSDGYSEIFSSDLSASYNLQIFNLSANYSLNRDLIENQSYSQPRLSLEFAPWPLYGGLLSAAFSNTLIFNRVRNAAAVEKSYSNNTAFRLSMAPFRFRKNLSLDLSLDMEQLTENRGRNITSGGIIAKAGWQPASWISVEILGNVQSRRKTRDWLIEGTTSQDVSGVLKLRGSQAIQGWLSLSYDPESGELRQSFADASIRFAERWTLHSLASYDFFLRKINNIDLYLIRASGRFQLRLVWRSLSRQFLVEFAPR